MNANNERPDESSRGADTSEIVVPPEALKAAEEVVEALDATQVEEVIVEREGFRLRVRRSPRVASRASAPEPSSRPSSSPRLRAVTSPLTGVFYRGPSPTAEPYVREGDRLEPETVVGLIETMKVFNEITADLRGQVVSFAAASGALVNAGDPLLHIAD